MFQLLSLKLSLLELKVRVELLCSRAAPDLILCCCSCSCSSTSASNCSPSLSKPRQPHNTRNAQPFKPSSLQKESTSKEKRRKRFHTLDLNINVSKLTCSSRFLKSHTGQQDTWRWLIKHEEQFLRTKQPVRPEGINQRFPRDFTSAQRKNRESHEKRLV